MWGVGGWGWCDLGMAAGTKRGPGEGRGDVRESPGGSGGLRDRLVMLDRAWSGVAVARVLSKVSNWTPPDMGPQRHYFMPDRG